MRGEDERSGSLFSYVDLEARVGKDHPLRTIRGVVNEALASLPRLISLFDEGTPLPSTPDDNPRGAILGLLLDTIGAEGS